MQTLVDPRGSAAAPAEYPQVAAYFETLQRAQVAYLAAAAAAGAGLPEAAAHLREASALQGRLTRRWFDAQRAILEQRAAVDRLAADCVDGRTFLPPSGIDGGRFERQLDALLDEWWQAERRTCSAASTLGSPVQPPVAFAVGAPSVDEPSTFTPPAGVADGGDDSLPRHLLEALESADPTALSLLLDELVAELDTHLAVAAAAFAPPVARAGDLVLVGAPDEHDERFQSFWTDPSVPAEPAFVDGPVHDAAALDRMSGLAARVVFPMVAVTAGLALALALIG